MANRRTLAFFLVFVVAAFGFVTGCGESDQLTENTQVEQENNSVAANNSSENQNDNVKPNNSSENQNNNVKPNNSSENPDDLQVEIDKGPPADDHFSDNLGEGLSVEPPVALYIYMDEDDIEELYTRDRHSDEQLPAQIHVSKDGPELDVRGLRFRGSTSRRYARKGYNIRLNNRPELDEYPNFNFRSEERGAGNRLLLNAMWTDPTGMREALNFGMYNHLGQPAPQTFYAQLYFNDVYEGLSIGIERIDREAMRRWKLNRKEGDFTLVRDESKSNRYRPEISERSIFGFDIDSVLSSDAERIELLQTIFDYRGEIEDHDWEGLLELVRWSHATPSGSQWSTQFAERFDVENVIDFLAIHSLTHDRDSLDTDYWLYRDHSEGAADGRWKFIPWDKNLTFGAHYFEDHRGENDFFDYDYDALSTLENGLVTKLLSTASLRRMYHERMTDLMENVFTLDYFREQIASLYAQVHENITRMPGPQAFVIHPQQHQGDLGRHLYHVNSLIDFVELRWQYLDRHINPVEGERYHATQTIENGQAGDVLFLTDSAGWVVARLALEESVADASISISVSQQEGFDGVDRVWTIDTGDTLIKGELSLYYRNTPLENWYPEEVASGGQWDLVMARRTGEEWTKLSSLINPYSNRVRARVELKGTTQFSLLHR